MTALVHDLGLAQVGRCFPEDPRDARPRSATETVLFQAVSDHLETFLDHMEGQGHPLPSWIEARLREFLRCGQPQYGFVRVRCHPCGVDRVVPFSCKVRGLCPSCGGRRMADLAAHWLDHMLPDVPIRQWVLTLPWPLRYRLAWDPALLAEVLAVHLRVLFRWQELRAKRIGSKAVQSGAITAIQRFGSALNLNPHFHSLVPDGVFVEKAHGVDFVRLPEPSDEDVGIVVATIRRRVLRLLHRRGMLDEGCQDPDLLLMDEPCLARFYGASIQGRLASGARAGQRVKRLGSVPGAPWIEMDSPQCARIEGFSLHAQVFIEAGRRDHLERLCRYIARPSVAGGRLRRLENGTLSYELKRRWSDGTSHVLFEPLELLEKLVALMPRPWTHLVRYHGVFAPNARLRSRVVPRQSDQRDAALQEGASAQPTSGKRRRVLPWAELMKRVFMVDVLACPRCGSTMSIISVLRDPDVVEKFLVCLGISPTPVVPAQSRAPPF